MEFADNMLLIHENHQTEESRLSLVGALDLEASVDLKSALAQCLARPQRVVRIDMAQLQLLSSTGVGALMHFQQQFNAVGGRVILCNLSEVCLRVLMILELRDFFTIE
ncbi:MAG: STAS domain-containing protein [Leptospirales bacterium]|nr:STAS domain-containing protein [Leptospirales bacterium]